MVALSIWAVAVLGANVSAIIPPSVYAALHASRIDGSTFNQLRASVASLEDEAARLKRENSQLLQRFSLAEDANGDVTRRVGALEASIPKLVESQFAQMQKLDPVATGSIGAKPVTFEAEGGLVAVQQRPLAPGSEVKLKPLPLAAAVPTLPSPAEASRLGVAIGFPLTAEQAQGQWQGLLAKAGTLLIGLSPVLRQADSGDGMQLVAGPVRDKSSAAELCARLDKEGIPCQPVPYAGQPVQLLN